MSRMSMRRTSSALSIIAFGLILLFSMDAFAGTLDAFEKSAKEERPGHGHHRGDDADSCMTDVLADILVDSFGYVMIYGGAVSLARVSPYPERFEIDCVPRRTGAPLIPFVRLDFSYQDVASDIDANDYRLEAGYGPFGVQFDQTHYKETSPADALDLIQIHGLYRMSFGSMLEVDLGVGVLTIDGNERDSRFSIALPVRIYPCDWLGLEVRPAWAENVTDWDLALLLGGHYVSLKAGYRWVNSPTESLHGPYAGFSIHY